MQKWTHRGLSPAPPACEAYVTQLQHAPNSPLWWRAQIDSRISGLVVEYIVAIDVTPAQFLADAVTGLLSDSERSDVLWSSVTHIIGTEMFGHTPCSIFTAAQSAKRSIRCSIVVSISACHAEDPGSIPGRGAS